MTTCTVFGKYAKLFVEIGQGEQGLIVYRKMNEHTMLTLIWFILSWRGLHLNILVEHRSLIDALSNTSFLSFYTLYILLAGLPGFARDCYCQLCLFASLPLSLCLSVSVSLSLCLSLYLSISLPLPLSLSRKEFPCFISKFGNIHIYMVDYDGCLKKFLNYHCWF